MIKQKIQFTDDELEVIAEKISEKLLKARFHNQDLEQQDKLLTIDELSDYTSIPKATLYGYVNKNTIPYYKPGKKLLFNRTEILKWLENGKKPLEKSTDDLVNECLTRKRRSA